MTPETPIVVVGGGPAGSACARELALQGHSVLLLAADGRASGPRFGESGGPALRRILVNNGLLLPPNMCSPLPTFLSAWGAEDLEGRSFAFWQAADGLVMDRPAFDRWLRDEAATAGAEVIRGCRVVGAQHDGDRWLVVGRVGGHDLRIPAQFVVEATGRVARSVFRAEVKRYYTDHLVCLSTELRCLSDEDAVALVESSEEGWWYAARGISGRLLVALFTDDDRILPTADRREWFAKQLHATRHVRELVDNYPRNADLQMCDARTSIRTVLWRGNWFSIGDAAWSLDPLSGSGVERAVNEGVSAGQALSKTILTLSPEPLREFAVSQVNSFKTAIHAQRKIYQRESRFKSFPFWRRRVF